MSVSELLQYASVGEQGSIYLGKNTVVNGSKHGREIGIFSHIHQDHIELFTYAMHECTAIFVSPPIFDLLAAIEQNENDSVSSEIYFGGRHIHRLDFDRTINPKKFLRNLDPKKNYSDQITLKKAHHILSSTQILVTTDDDKDIGYSSDFSYSETEPMKCNALVLDSTQGDPMFNTIVDSNSLENRLVEDVNREIEAGNPVCIRSHVGRLQYIMSLLSKKIGMDIPFLSESTNKKLAPIYNKHDMPIRKIIDSYSYDGREKLEKNYPFIEFKTNHEAKSEPEMDNRSTVFHLEGFCLGGNATFKQKLGNEKNYYLEFADHGNYDNILKYVNRCNPELVIIDNYKSGWGETLAEKIKSDLDIDAIAQP